MKSQKKQPWQMTFDEWKRTPEAQIEYPVANFKDLNEQVKIKAKLIHKKITGGDLQEDNYDSNHWFYDKETGELFGDDIPNYLEIIEIAIKKRKQIPKYVLDDFNKMKIGRK